MASEFQSLAPALLLAAPRLGDPNFERSVVLLGRHEADGALGWVLNGAPVAPVGVLLKAADLVPEGVRLPTTGSFARPARIGGPVSPRSGWLLYRRVDRSFAGQVDVGEKLALCNDPTALHAVLGGEPPREFHLLVGYAGWGPGQLEAELKQGAWLPGTVDAELLLGTPTERLWDAAYRSATGASPGSFNGKVWASA